MSGIRLKKICNVFMDFGVHVLCNLLPFGISGTDLNSTTNRIYKDSNAFMKTVENISI